MFLYFNNLNEYVGSSQDKMEDSDSQTSVEVLDADFAPTCSYSLTDGKAIKGEELPTYQDTAEDIATRKQEPINTSNLSYLASTDWYVTRNTETGVAIPADITQARTAARIAIK
jgi:hypothetical protein